MKTTRLSRGSSTEMSLRLCSRAPRTTRWSCWGRGAADGREEGTAVTRFMLGARTDSRCIAAYGGRHGDPDRGLRGARRHGDGRPGRAAPAPSTGSACPTSTRTPVSPPCWARPRTAAGCIGPVGAGADDAAATSTTLVRARDHPRDRHGRGEGDRPHAARRRPRRPHPPGPGGARAPSGCATSGSCGSTTAGSGPGCPGPPGHEQDPRSSPRSPGRTCSCCAAPGSRSAEDGHHRDEFEVSEGEELHLLHDVVPLAQAHPPTPGRRRPHRRDPARLRAPGPAGAATPGPTGSRCSARC